jgi:Protein of unknown function (DUF2510)
VLSLRADKHEVTLARDSRGDAVALGKKSVLVAMPSAPAKWYPDPNNASQWRYWDGSVWTEHYAPRGVDVLTTDRSPACLVERTDPPNLAARMPTLVELVARARLEPPRHPLDEQVEVAGETYHVKGIKKVFREHRRAITDAGCTLEDVQCILAPEPWNPHDSAAVAVMVGQHQVGYLPSELACHYARPLAVLASGGVLATGLARIWAQTNAGVVRARVTILIPEADQF